ncbi:28S ribosomal protein S5, mitochondrial-like [Macrosteles quadrilineatus]|uniref:28S ribosomal protein S5, mitochondrial-like n=1 Tax=Macrosteles quadrilineatus TaxID=74068 RepID=UPI0023E3430C|nr:28S ribosomal protein S5, mitochondrial-like [Macrosteles quadrilineatus]
MIPSILGNSIRYGNKVQALSTLFSAMTVRQAVPASHVQIVIRTSTTSFFNKLPAENLWKGVTSVSNAGRKRGRASGGRKKHAKNLNKGQVIGVGKANIIWPGLNSPVIRGKEVVKQQKLPEDPEREAKLIKIRSEMVGFRPLKLSPIERGWTGAKLGGRMLGPPDPIGEDKFEGFNSVVVEYKQVFHMTGNLGRKRQVSAFVVTGNGEGLAGFARGKAVEGRVALVTAKNRAGQKLMYIERYNDHTVMHDFFAQFGSTKIFVKKVPEGYGLKCHRAIKSMCQVIGIKDIHAKVEGAINIQNITKAFFLGLLQQKTHEQLAEETGYHLVEFREENGELPIVLASPQEPKQDSTDPPDFDQYIMNNRVALQRKKFPPFYADTFGYKKHLWQAEKRRTHEKSKLQMIADYGKVRSFLGEKYPEAHIDYAFNKYRAEKKSGEQ